MRPFSTQRRLGAPCPHARRNASRPLFGLTIALAAAGATIGGQPARAAVDENWADSAIRHMRSEGDSEAGQRRRHRSAGEDEADAGDDGVRPQRSTPVKRKAARGDHGKGRLASLGRDTAPAPLRPLSVIEWARPKTEIVLPAAPPKGLGPMVASLGRDLLAPPPSAGPGLTGDPIRWLPLASSECLAGPLRGVLSELAATFGPLTVRWTCRDKQLNARVGGAKRSYHLTGNAVDFNMTGNYRAILAFLKAKKEVGGLKHYGGGAFHIDTGPRRTW